MISSKNDHSHDKVPGKPKAQQIVERMKNTARNKQDSVYSAVIATQVVGWVRFLFSCQCHCGQH